MRLRAVRLEGNFARCGSPAGELQDGLQADVEAAGGQRQAAHAPSPPGLPSVDIFDGMNKGLFNPAATLQGAAGVAAHGGGMTSAVIAKLTIGKRLVWASQQRNGRIRRCPSCGNMWSGRFWLLRVNPRGWDP